MPRPSTPAAVWRRADDTGRRPASSSEPAFASDRASLGPAGERIGRRRAGAHLVDDDLDLRGWDHRSRELDPERARAARYQLEALDSGPYQSEQAESLQRRSGEAGPPGYICIQVQRVVVP